MLSEWGAWKRGENIVGLGYPDRSAFMRLAVDGIRRLEPYAPYIDEDLMTLDGDISLLFPEMRIVIVAHYVWQDTTKNKIKRLQLSRSRYYDILEMAHRQLMHWRKAEH